MFRIQRLHVVRTFFNTKEKRECSLQFQVTYVRMYRLINTLILLLSPHTLNNPDILLMTRLKICQ